MFGKGKLASDMCSGTATLTEAEWLDVCVDAEFDVPTTAANSATLHACQDTYVYFIWTAKSGGVDACGAEVIQVADYELPDWVIDLRCPEDGTCGVEKSVKDKPRYGHFCNCVTDPEGEDIWDDTQIAGEYVDIIVSGSVQAGTGDSTSVLTDADCAVGSCQLTFDTKSLTPSKAVLKTKQVCVFCQPTSPEDGTDIEIDGLFAVGSAGAAKTITGTELDVLVSAELGYTGSGGSGDGCPPGSGSAGATITITGKTKKVCTFCSADGEGNFEDGVDIDLLDGLSFGLIVAISEADFTCSPCPSLSTKYQTGYVLCVTEESEALVSSCTCIDCEEGSGSGA
jgi:hypothetical protein